MLDGGEVPRVLEKRESGVLQRAALLGILGGPHLGAAHLVERVLHQPVHVETVEDDLAFFADSDTAEMYACDMSIVTTSSNAHRSVPSS